MPALTQLNVINLPRWWYAEIQCDRHVEPGKFLVLDEIFNTGTYGFVPGRSVLELTRAEFVCRKSSFDTKGQTSVLRL